MGTGSAALLVAAGVASGLAGSMAGLASLFSYPALLAAGLPPVAANVTNTVALLSNALGTAAGSRAELSGQRDRLLRLAAIAAVGGAIGAALLLDTPASAFQAVVPWLIAAGSVLILVREPVRRLLADRPGPSGRSARPTPALALAVLLVGLYGGYFGAAAGVLMLAVLSLSAREPLPVTNAVKNIATGAANMTAAVAYALVAPVHWGAAVALGLGCLIGSRAGPVIVRRIPETPLRVVIALAGLGLAVALWRGAGT